MKKLRTSLNPSLLVGGIIVIIVLLMAIISLLWTPYDPITVHPADRLEGPGVHYILGTDRYGRDMLSMIMVGSRISILVGFIATIISLCFGSLLGLWAALGNKLGTVLILRGLDILIALPGVLFAIVLGAMFGSTTTTAMIAIGIAGIPACARIVRNSTRQILHQDYMDAATLAGVGTMGKIWRHILPNILGILLVHASTSFALAILAEAGLSFLGLGTAPPNPSWGRMLQSAQGSLSSDPLLALWPGLAIALTVLGFTLLGDGLRHYYDPRSSILGRRNAR
ncbi:MAG: ABC transporter permease [Corynebacterium sp.]|nr:ABC transporter permease [Corynebacterium sp.]